MELGAFSISLAVTDLETSRSFYEKLGFRVFAGDASQNWLILKNGEHAIGLFQGMFEKNILTFNPGSTAVATTAQGAGRPIGQEPPAPVGK
jgi:lactoylglutathione lyase